MELAIGVGIFTMVCIFFGYLVGYKIGRHTTKEEVRKLLEASDEWTIGVYGKR